MVYQGTKILQISTNPAHRRLW